MGRRNKLQKFADIQTFPNVYENADTDNPENVDLLHTAGTIVRLKGKWNTEHFKNNNPIVLELACGRGEYSLALAQKYPEKNFIGVDIKGARLWQGSRIATENDLHNVAFLRTRIEMLANFFGPDEITEIWITFPDPFLRECKSDRRLTSIPFLSRYKEVLKRGGLIHLKTDDDTLYEYSLETYSESSLVDLIYHSNDIYADSLPYSELEYKTYYEQKHLKNGKSIKYIRSTLN